MPLHPYIRGDPHAKRGEQKVNNGPQQGKTTSEVAASHLSFGGPKNAANATSPLHSQGSPTPSAGRKKTEVVPNKAEQNQNWLPQPCFLAGPKNAANATSPLHSQGPPRPSAGSKNSEFVPNKGGKNQKWVPQPCLAFLGAKKGPQMLCQPWILWDSQQRGRTSEVVASTLPSRRPKKGRKCYVTPTFPRIPNAKHGEQKIKSVPQQTGTKSELVASPVPSAGPIKGQKCYVTLAFWAIPNVKHGELKDQKWSRTKGKKIRSGCLTPAFSGA